MKKFTTILTAIATIAIVWYLLTSYEVLTNWWSLPTIAISTGLLSLILPVLVYRFKATFSIISTGLLLFIIQIVKSFMSVPFWTLGLLIFSIAIITEVVVNNVSFGDLLIDFAFSLIASYLIIHFSNTLITLLILILTYLLVTLVGFSFKFNLKESLGKSKKKAPKVSKATTVNTQE